MASEGTKTTHTFVRNPAVYFKHNRYNIFDMIFYCVFCWQLISIKRLLYLFNELLTNDLQKNYFVTTC